MSKKRCPLMLNGGSLGNHMLGPLKIVTTIKGGGQISKEVRDLDSLLSLR